MLGEIQVDWSGVPVAAAFIIGFALGVFAIIALAKVVVEYLRGKD